MNNQIYHSQNRLSSHFLPLAVALLSIHGCLAEAQHKSDRGKDNLSGPVHRVRSETTVPQRSEGPTNGSEPGTVETTYNHKGNKTEELRYKSDGSLLTKTVLDYDNTEKLAQVTVYSPDSSIYLKRTYSQADRDAKKTEEYIWGAGGTSLISKVVRTYDGAARVTEVLSVNGEGRQDRQVLSYNSKGDLAEITYFMGKDTRGAKVIFVYDTPGQLTEMHEYDADGALATKQVFSGDTERGSDVTFFEYNAQGKLVSKERYVRELDSHGNWIKETKLAMNSNGAWETVGITQRQITYY